MSTDQRTALTAIVRWISGAGMVIVGLLLWTQLQDLSPLSWLLLVSMAIVVALVVNLGVDVSYGQVTFMPVAALMAYFALGLQAGLAVLIVGLLLGGVGHFLRAVRHPRDRQQPWWRRTGQEIWPIARNGVSMLAAHWAFTTLGATPPLEALTSREVILAALQAPVIYLVVHDLLLAVDLWLRGFPVILTLMDNRRALLAIQLLPLALAPFASIALYQVGLAAFLLFEIILLAIAVVVNRMTWAQSSLQHQVTQLRSFSAMSQALRSSLQIDELLTTLYEQVSRLLGVRNLRVLLSDKEDRHKITQVFAIENGVRVQRDLTSPLDDLTRRVLEGHDPVLIQHIDPAVQRLGLSTLPRARAWLGVPLLASDHALGAMVTWLEPGEQPERTFTETDLAMFAAISTHAGMTLENALLYEAAQQHAAQLARLNQISTVMNASLNPERVLELISESVIDVAGCHKAAIYLLEQDTPEPSLLLTHAQGFSPEHIARSKDIAVPLTDAERKQVMDEGRPVPVSNLHNPEAGVSPLALLLAKREGFASYCYLPLRAQKQPIGMLAVYYNQPHQFSRGEIELLETFANQAALAVVNARIYQRVDVQLARRVEQIVRMADINQRLTSSLNLETVFGLIIDSAMEGCEADRGVLLLLGEPELGQEGEGLNMVAWRGFNPERSLRMPHHIAEEVADSRVLKEGETQLISGDDPTSSQPRSHLSLPIILEDRVIGAIALESDAIAAFTGEDVTFVSQLAVQAAVAIRNAQLYKRTQMVRDRLEAILDASNDGLLMIDAKSRIVMTNARMGDFWDFARGDYQPRSPDQFIADPLTALGEGLGYREGELQALLGKAMRNPGMKFPTDLYATRAGSNQQQRFVERSVAPVHDEEGAFLGLLLIFRDVTKQKELEQAREDLTSMIVHDLRSPLQAIMGSMRLLGEVAPKDSPMVTQATSVSSRAVKKLLNLVNNLLDLSRLERGEFVLNQSAVSVADILNDAAAELLPLAQEMDALISVDSSPDLPESSVDKDMVERVVLNLLDNALKYSPPGTVVTLRANMIKGDDVLRRPQKEPMLRVQVVDQGPGVPDDYKERIFDRYTQVPGTKGRRASAGLGLAFCKLAIESHGGAIWVEDNPSGKNGSAFSFTLPVVRSASPADAPDKQTQAQPGSAEQQSPASAAESPQPGDARSADAHGDAASTSSTSTNIPLDANLGGVGNGEKAEGTPAAPPTGPSTPPAGHDGNGDKQEEKK